MSKNNAKGLTTLRQKLRKYIRDAGHETDLKNYREVSALLKSTSLLVIIARICKKYDSTVCYILYAQYQGIIWTTKMLKYTHGLGL